MSEPKRPARMQPTPADPYPLNVAGLGPEVGTGLLSSRWAENWTGMRAAGYAQPFKAMPLCGEASLTLSAEDSRLGVPGQSCLCNFCTGDVDTK